MAKMKNKKDINSQIHSVQSGSGSMQGMSREQTEQYGGEAVGADEENQEIEESTHQAAGSRQVFGQQSQGPLLSNVSDRAMGGRKPTAQEFDPGQLLGSAREFIEGHPGRATLLGAAVGGVVAALFATEKGRSLVSAAYSYSRPMITDYARRFITGSSEDMAERSLPQ